MNKKEKLEEIYNELVISIKKELTQDSIRNGKKAEEVLKKIGTKREDYDLIALTVSNIKLEQELNREHTNKIIEEIFLSKWSEIECLLEDIKILLQDEIDKKFINNDNKEK